jgi:hypothetical protein
MNETTLQLSRLIGPVTLLIGLSFALHKEFYMDWLKNLKKNGAFLFLAAIIEATAGFAIVLSHNLWTTTPEIIISVLGFGMILEGTLVLLGGKSWVKLAVRLLSRTAPWFMISALATLALGGYLTWIGYFVMI